MSRRNMGEKKPGGPRGQQRGCLWQRPAGRRPERYTSEALEPRLLLSTKVLSAVPFYNWFYGCTPTVTGEIMGYYNRTFTNLFPGSNATTRDSIVTGLIASTQDQVAGQENGRLTYDGKVFGAGDWENSTSYPNHEQNPDCIADFVHTVGGNTQLADVTPGITNYLNWRGYSGWTVRQSWYSAAGFQDVVNSIDAGRPVMAIVDLTGSGVADHAAPIAGYNTDNHTFAVVDNSAQGLPGSTSTLQWANWGPVTVGHIYGILATIQITPPIVTSPFSGTPLAVPGVIQAEDLRNGLTAMGSAFDHTGVGIEPTADTGGGYDVGWTTAGQWLGYNVNAATAGSYSVNFRVANPGTGGTFHLDVDGSAVSGAITVPNTGAWTNWQTLSVGGVSLPAGQHNLKVVFDANSSDGYVGNFNWIKFSAAATAAPGAPANVSASNGVWTDKVRVAWGTVTGATAYDVFRSTTNDPATVGSAIGSSSSTFFDDTAASAGTSYYYFVKARNSGGSSALSASSAGRRVTTLTTNVPYYGAALALPGIIQAEDFDRGGEGLGYHDTTAGNSGGAARTTENVDIEATSDVGLGCDIGWTAAGEWLAYSVNAQVAGTYAIDARVAAPVTGGSFHIAVDGVNVTGAVTVPKTGGWQTFLTVGSGSVALTAGPHVVKLVVDGGAPNFNWLGFNLQSTPTPVPYPDPTTPTPLPGVIHLANFDTGGEGVSYHDTTAGNLGGEYRPADGVDLEVTSDTGGGYDVGWTAAGEWMTYTVNLAQAGAYDMGVRVAASTPGGQFHVELDGADITGPMDVPPTGGWASWQTITKDGLSLPAGQHVLRLVIDAAASSGFAGNFNWLSLTPGVAQPVATLTGGVLTLYGTAGADSFILSAAGSSMSVDVNGDTQTLPFASGQQLVVNGGAGNDTLSITGGNWIMNADARATTPALAVALNNAALTFNATEHLSSLTLSAGSRATMAGAQTVLVTHALTLSGSPGAWTSTLDLAGNAMIILGGAGAETTTADQVGYARDNGAFDRMGITSTTAAGDLTRNHGLNVLSVAEAMANGNTLAGGFLGVSVGSNDMLVQYGWNGDLNLDGQVNYLDYGAIDNAYLYNLAHPATPKLGFPNGDLTFDGVINYLDYGVIDNAFLTLNARGAGG